MAISTYGKLTYVTPEEAKLYRDWLLKNENDDFNYWCKIRELDEHRNMYCTDIVMMDQQTKDLLEPRFTSIWEDI
jgi:hypothetical protein